MAFSRVCFYTDAHRIEGGIALRERLAEALNDRLTDYLELADVVVDSAADRSRIATWAHGVIPKHTILAASLDESEHESRSTRIDKLVPKSGREMAAVVGNLMVSGTGHLKTGSMPSAVLRGELAAFFPITEATIRFPAGTQVDTKLALVNRDAIRIFTLA